MESRARCRWFTSCEHQPAEAHMTELLDQLRQQLEAEQPPLEATPRPSSSIGADAAIWRFLHAWRSHPMLGADHAVLLRQIARWLPQLHISKVPPSIRPF